jgi:hypothetical protein
LVPQLRGEVSVPLAPTEVLVPEPLGQDLVPEASGEGSGRRATTTIRLDADGRLGLHRPGAQDRAHDDYLEYLLTTYA